MIKEFRDFLMRGNIVDLAVAVVIGGAFGAVVTSLVDNIIMPIIGIFGGQPDFTANTFSIRDSEFGWGAFLTALVSFIIIAAVIFFVVVKPMNALMERIKRGEAPAAEEVLPPTWEYRTSSEAELNALGAQGWELVGVSTGGFHLKRPLTS
ncbi:MAG: large conductance mechanosensitive channel protein MscL [Chloroflexota bacterium]|nr:large conductance mechanosensitive channel protein MscL [Chloroflexota bacterium]